MSDLNQIDTKKKPRRAHRSPTGPGLYVTDLELSELLGVPEETLRVAIAGFEKQDRSFPKKDPLFGNRRWWPAVKSFLDRLNGVKISDPQGGGSHDRQTTRNR